MLFDKMWIIDLDARAAAVSFSRAAIVKAPLGVDSIADDFRTEVFPVANFAINLRASVTHVRRGKNFSANDACKARFVPALSCSPYQLCHEHRFIAPWANILTARCRGWTFKRGRKWCLVHGAASSSVFRLAKTTWKLGLIANVRSLSLTLAGDGGIAAPEKILSMNLQFQEGWGNFSPFLFLHM